jgi:hypothetical protein
MNPIFCGSKLKIERANQHINELNAALTTFLRTGAGGVRVDTDFAGRDTLVLDAKPLPKGVPLILGDAVHNMRAALDLMACEIVTIAGGTPSKHCNFPIRDTKQELIGTVNGGEIKIAGNDICDLIVNVIKPYIGGNDPIWGLNKIDNIDKHRLLNPTVGIIQVSGVCAHDDNNNTFTNITLGVDSGGRLNAISTTARMHITNYGLPAFGVFFPTDSAFEGQPLIPTLHQLAQVVSDVIQAVEKAYLARSTS